VEEYPRLWTDVLGSIISRPRLTSVVAEDVDPSQNIDALKDLEEKHLQFPFNVTEEDKERIKSSSTTNE
jgi:hypothetical protein